MEKTGKNTVPLVPIPSFQPFAASLSGLWWAHAARDGACLICCVFGVGLPLKKQRPLCFTRVSPSTAAIPWGLEGMYNSFSPPVDKGREQRRDVYYNSDWGLYISLSQKKPRTQWLCYTNLADASSGHAKGYLEVSTALKQREEPFRSGGEQKSCQTHLDFFLSELLSPLHKILFSNISWRVLLFFLK